MEFNLSNKVALVTGASKGIGAGIAKALAAEGATVVVNYANSQTNADRVVAEITANGGKAIAIRGDVSLAGDVKQLFDQAADKFGAIDILVNNAGIAQFGPVEAIAVDAFHQIFNVNVLGPFLTIREALRHFPQSGGSIINISSVAGQNPGAYASLYGSSKAAVDAMTHGLAKELAPRHIRVNTVAPGPTDTEGVRAQGIAGTDFEKALIAATPLDRLGQPGEIASVVVFLASDAGAWLTGERIRASGGLQ